MKKDLREQREREAAENAKKPETGAGKPAPKKPLKPLTLKELAVRLAETANTFSNELEARDERLEDLEKRLTKLELAAEQTASASAEPEPVAEPQNESAPQPEPAPQSQGKQPEPEAQFTKTMGAGKNGPGRGFIYWDWRTRTYGITPDFWGAKQLSNDIPEPIWVWYKNGRIDHELSDEEIAKYTP